MLNFRKHAATLAAVAFVLGVTFVACSDDDDPSPTLRSKTYTLLRSIHDSAQIGSIQLTENRDSSVNLSLTLDKTTANVKHPLFVIYGTAQAPTTDTMLIDSLAGTGNKVTKVLWKDIDSVMVGNQKRKFNYDSAVALNAFSKVLYSASKDSVIAIGNILKSAK